MTYQTAAWDRCYWVLNPSASKSVPHTTLGCGRHIGKENHSWNPRGKKTDNSDSRSGSLDQLREMAGEQVPEPTESV